jgi:DNA-directed RNA polymerase specialized sigma24 family protein
MRGRRANRCVAQEVEDLCQDVLLALFDHDARALRAWSPHRGRLEAFVSILAEHEVASIMRSGRRRPWRDEEDGSVDLDGLGTLAAGPESIVALDELLEALAEGLRAELTPSSLAVFRALVVDGQSIAEVRAATRMTRDAVYASRARHLKVVRRLLAGLAPS